MEQERKEKFHVNITTLKYENSYRQWFNGINSYLQSKQLKHLIDYKIQLPCKIETNVTEDSLLRQRVINEPAAKVVLLLKVPENVKQLVRSAPSIRLIHDETPDLPDELVEMVLETDLIILTGNLLYPIFENSLKMLRFRNQLIKNKEKVRTILRSSMSAENMHLLDNATDVADSFNNIRLQFEKDCLIH